MLLLKGFRKQPYRHKSLRQLFKRYSKEAGYYFEDENLIHFAGRGDIRSFLNRITEYIELLDYEWLLKFYDVKTLWPGCEKTVSDDHGDLVALLFANGDVQVIHKGVSVINVTFKESYYYGSVNFLFVTRLD